MNDKYQIEIDEFIERFGDFKAENIILYGVGRYTATLLEGVQGFHFVGLMDKDPANTGKIMFGLPIVDKATAEKIADMIIINTSETYWDVIYNRIEDIALPVFYKNGLKAKKKEYIKFENPFKDLSYTALCEEINRADVVSFDFFDSLFMRSVCNPRDIFRLLEIELALTYKGQNKKDTRNIEEYEKRFDLIQLREQSKREIRDNYSLDELYAKIENISGLPHNFWVNAKNIELVLEKKQLVPRREVIEGLMLSLELGKDVYIISDMYLPEAFYREIFEQYGIVISAGHILLSNALNLSKEDGMIWKYYTDNIVKGRAALHIGDNLKADVKEPKKYGIKTYLTPSAWDLLRASSIKEVASSACSDYALAIVGCILKKLFRNPYVLEHTDGMVEIRTNHEMGYYVFGPIILTFLLWLLQKSEKDHVSKLVFMSRDGYFLKEDFEYLCKQDEKQRACCYLGISRQLAIMASVESKQELMEYLSMPYTGSITELFEDRIGIKGVQEISNKSREDYIEDYLAEIENIIDRLRENYLHYIEKLELNDTCAVVDLGYYGNNQRYLNKLIKKRISGYYFNVNLSKQNKNTESQKMIGCFQKEDDITGANSQVLKKMIYLESFLTAPYGMVKGVDAKGNFICAPKKKNQEHFQEKVEMNQGVKRFIHDYFEVFGTYKNSLDLEFIDWYYGYCFGGAMRFSEEVKNSFYNDNAMMNRIESMLFC